MSNSSSGIERIVMNDNTPGDGPGGDQFSINGDPALFRRNAKFAGQVFSPEQADQDVQRIEHQYGETLDLIEN